MTNRLKNMIIIKYIYIILISLMIIGIGSILITLGVLWSESLQTIDYLKDFAYLIKDNLENYSDIKIPTLNTGNDIPNNTVNNIISLAGIYMLSLLGSMTVLIITDYFIPGFAKSIAETFVSIPILGPMINNVAIILDNTINDIISPIINWFTGNNLPTGDNLSTPDSISRSSSGGSDTSQITIKDTRLRTPSPIASSSKIRLEDITPPISRVNTPFDNPVPDGINTFDPG
jgi:hypothetical protein